MLRKQFIKNNSALAPLKLFLIFFVIVAIICLLWYIWSISEITCNPEDQAELSGAFKGYYPSQDYSGFTSVVIGNNSFLFRRGLDQSYLSNLIGFDVCFVCCERTSSSQYQPETYYDFLSGVIIME